MPVTERRRAEGQQFLSFYFGGEEYATEILRVREVVEYQRLTPVPTTPAWVRGVMNLRGTVVPVLDLAAKLQQGETAVEKHTCIVIFEVDLAGDPTPMGVMIDLVGRVLELQEDEIQDPPDFGSPVRIELLEGLGMVEDKPVPILDIQKVLTEDELAATVAGTEAAVQEDGTEPSGGPPTEEAKGKTKKRRDPTRPATKTDSPKAGKSSPQPTDPPEGEATERSQKKAKKAKRSRAEEARPKSEQPAKRSGKAKSRGRRSERDPERRKAKAGETSEAAPKPETSEASSSTGTPERPKQPKRPKTKKPKKPKKAKKPTDSKKSKKSAKSTKAKETKPTTEVEGTGTNEKTRQADEAATDRAGEPKAEPERSEKKRAKKDRTEPPREGAPTGTRKKGSSDDAKRSRGRESEGPKGGSDGGAKG